MEILVLIFSILFVTGQVSTTTDDPPPIDFDTATDSTIQSTDTTEVTTETTTQSTEVTTETNTQSTEVTTETSTQPTTTAEATTETNTQSTNATTETSTQSTEATTETSTQLTEATTETSTQSTEATTETSTQSTETTTETSTQSTASTEETTTTIETTTVIHGQWGEWAAWGSCSAFCGSGTMYRTRPCDSPPPGPGGDNCTGTSEDSSSCDTGQECCAPQVYDLAFLIDVSYYSLSSVRTVFKEIVDVFDISLSKTRVSLATFSSTQTVQFDFTTYSTATDLKNAIDDGISYSYGTTNPREALEYVRSTIFTTANGARDDVSDVLIIYVTKSSYSYDNTWGTTIDDDPKAAAQRLKDNGVYIIALEGRRQSELESYGDVYYSFSYLYSSDRTSIISLVENGFPCNYFCSVSSFSLDSPANLGTGNDTTSGTLYLMTDAAYQMTCCGSTSTWEFFAVYYGIIEVMIFRLVGLNQYYLVGSTRIVIPEDYAGTVVSFSLIAGERVAFVTGDFLGWYTSGPNIVGHADCTTTSRTDCPQNNKLLTKSRDSFGVGDTIDFSAATTVPNRGYSMKLATVNNTELIVVNIQNDTEIEENTPIGYNAMYFSVTDSDLNDNLTMSLSGDSALFEMTDVVNEKASLKLKTKLPVGGGTYVMTVTGTDSCQHSATTTVTVATYNAPPVVNNLPAILEISELTDTAIHLYTINVTDATNDEICCTLSHTLPNTFNFEFKDEGGVYSIWTVANPAFSYGDVDSYRIFICCQDQLGSTNSYLMLRLIENKIEEVYVAPDWFGRAIVVSMVPISIMTMLTFIILVITMFCMDPNPVAERNYEVEISEQSVSSQAAYSDENIETDNTSISSSSSSRNGTASKPAEETIYVKHALTKEEYYIPVWRGKTKFDGPDPGFQQPGLNPQSSDNFTFKAPNSHRLNNGNLSFRANNKTFPQTNVPEVPLGQNVNLEMKLIHYGGEPPAVSTRTTEERAYDVSKRKNEIKHKYKELVAKAEAAKKKKLKATPPANKMETKVEVHQDSVMENETMMEVQQESITENETMMEVQQESITENKTKTDNNSTETTITKEEEEAIILSILNETVTASPAPLGTLSPNI